MSRGEEPGRWHGSRSRSPVGDRRRDESDAAPHRRRRSREDISQHSGDDEQQLASRQGREQPSDARHDREHQRAVGHNRHERRNVDADNDRRRQVHDSIEAWTGSRREAHRDARQSSGELHYSSRDDRHGSRDDRHGSRNGRRGSKDERHGTRERQHGSTKRHPDSRDGRHGSRDGRRSTPDGQHRKRSRSRSADDRHHRSNRAPPAARARHHSPPRSPMRRVNSSRDDRDGRATRNRSPSPQQRHAGLHAARALPGPPPSDEPPAVGSIHQGHVHTIRPFGIFVAIDGYKRHVLIHHTQVAEDISLTRDDEDDIKVKALEFAAPKGTRVFVKILEVSPDPQGAGFRVHGSMRAVSQQDGTDLDPTGLLAMPQRGGGGGGPLSEEAPEENSIHRAVVKKVEPYGVFVALDGYKKHGLVHSSQVSNYLSFSAEDTDEEKKAAMLEVLAIGDVVWVKVVEVSDDGSGRGPRIGCSIKLVNQTDGQDLDPMGSRYKPRGEGGGGGRGRGAPIGADAGEVGRGGKIDWGYLQADTKQYNGRQYDLLDEDAPPAPRGGAAAGPTGRPAQPQGAPSNLPPIGRGRGAVMPAWMASGAGPAAPGSGTAGAGTANGAGAAGNAGIGSVEEALAILRELKSLNKHKKSKKHKKHKKHKHGKKEGKRRRSRSGSSSSSSDGDSGGSR